MPNANSTPSSETQGAPSIACLPNHLTLEQINISDLRKAPRETRKHSPEQVKKIARSLEKFGFVAPILIDRQNEIIAGHARVDAALEGGFVVVPAIRVEHLTPEQVRAYRIADNRLAEDATWDQEALQIEFLEILDLGIDLEVTGFEVPQIDLIIGDDEQERDHPEDLQPSDEPVVSRPGDVWLLGEHRIICGSALEQETYKALLEAELASVVFTDPPYNVPINKHVCGLGEVKHPEFLMASGEMSDEEFRTFLETFLSNAERWLKVGGIAFACMDWRHIEEILGAGRSAGLDLLNFCVWAKTNGGMGSFYRSQHELVPVFKKPGAAHLNNVQLGKHGRYRTNLWTYPGISSLGGERDEALAMHPTVKPTKLVSDAILDCTKRGDIVLDPFGGSGTTMIAAEQTGRRARLIELDPSYIDVTLRRVAKAHGISPTLLESGASFEEVRLQRKGGAENE